MVSKGVLELMDHRIKEAKERIKDLEEQYKKSGNPLFLNKIEDEHRKIRSIHANDMEKLD